MIAGTCDGQRVELRGSGFIGYNERGTVEGRLRRLPVFLIDKLPDYPDADEPEIDRAEWLASIGTVKPKLSEDYRRAVVGIGFQRHVIDDEG